jgi:glycosyltransferase involved in cell wall biosynthesis
VAVVRRLLFEPGQTFIAAQAGSMTRYAPVLVGERLLGPRCPSVEALAVGTPRWKATGFDLLGRSRDLDRALEQVQPDVVHAHFGPDGLLAAPSAHRLGVPLVVTLHGFDATMTSGALVRLARPAPIRYAVERSRLDRVTSRVVCVCEFIAERAARFGIGDERRVVHYIGVDVDRVQARPWPRPPVVAHVARLVEKKGTADLIRAFAAVAPDVAEARLVVFGDGPLRAELEALADELAPGRVDFRGFVPHDAVLEALAEARVLAAPSVTAQSGDAEGLPISVLEGMSAGLPVVATRHAGIPEAVDHDRTGLLVDEHDVGSLAAALEHYLLDESAAERAGSAGAAEARARFDLRAQTEELERLYDEVISEWNASA